MATAEEFVPIPGSDHAQPAEARRLDPADPEEVLRVTLMVRHKVVEGVPPLHELVAEIASGDPSSREHLKHEEYEANYGADPVDVARVVRFAGESGLEVVETSLSRRTVKLSGTVKAFSAAFHVELTRYQLGKETYRGRTGPIFLPADLGPIVVGVFGLENRARFRPLVVHAPRPLPVAGFRPLVAGDLPPYSPEQVAAFYHFPAHLDGEGQTIGIIELGGGFYSEDLDLYARHVAGRTVPSVTIFHVDGTQNDPQPDAGSLPFSAYSENLLDIEIVAAVVPKAKIVVYFAPNDGLLDAVSAAVDDRTNLPKVLSISWGGPEEPGNLQSFYDSLEQVFLKAASLGITVCAASGDDGSAQGVNYPASSPNVLACGGTSLTSVANGSVAEEDAWSGSGGGVSVLFPIPMFQAAVGVEAAVGTRGRGVPDVAGNADPRSGYDIVSAAVDLQMSGGTSAVAPLWAALIAQFNQDLGKRSPGKTWGLITPLLYGFAAGGATGGSPFRDIVSGSNGGFSAGPGWDAVTGLGSPDGGKLLDLLQSLSASDDE